MKKIKEIGFVIGLILFTVINVRSNQLAINNNPSLDSLTDYLVDVEKGGDKVVVVLVSGTAFINKEAIQFVDKQPLDIAKRELKRAGYSIITLSTPCAIRCLDQYTELGLLILELEADAVIYKGIHSDFGTDNLDKILKKANIPIYSYGSEVAINYTLYTGPDNDGLAKAVRTGLEKEAEEGSKVIYIDTITKFTDDKLDNGYQRIKAVKNYLNELGLIEVETVHTFWNRARTFEEITRVLNQEEDVDYIIAPSIETALGAAEAVELAKYEDIKIIAMDFTDEGVELLKEGKIYGLVSQELQEQGFALAVNIIAGNLELGTKLLFSSESIITLENLKDYEIATGVYRW